MTAPAVDHPSLQATEAAWADLLAEIDAIPAAEQTLPGAVGDWSVNDLLGHIAAWDAATLAADGGAPQSERDIDAFNAREVARRAGRPLAAQRAEMETAHTALVTALHRQLTAGSGTAGLCACGREAVADHYAGHAADLRAWRRRSR